MKEYGGRADTDEDEMVFNPHNLAKNQSLPQLNNKYTSKSAQPNAARFDTPTKSGDGESIDENFK